MPELGLSEDSPEGVSPQDGGNVEQDKPQPQSPWFGPLTTAEYLLKKVYRYGTSQPVTERRPAEAHPLLKGLAPYIVVAAIVAAIAYAAHLQGLLQTPEHVMAVFTFVLAVIAGVQWWTTTRQLKQTDEMIEHMRLERRAWLHFDDAILKGFSDGMYDCQVTLKNYGLTPAYIDLYIHHIIIVPKGHSIAKFVKELVRSASPEHQKRKRMVVAPGEKHEIPIGHRNVPPNVPAGVDDNLLDLFLVSRIYYRDVMGVSRKSQTCFRLSAGEFRIYFSHNYMK